MPDELLGPLFDDLGLHQRPEGSHDAAKEMAATSQVAPRKKARKEDLKESRGNRAETRVMWHTHQPRICQETLRPEKAEGSLPWSL